MGERHRQRPNAVQSLPLPDAVLAVAYQYLRPAALGRLAAAGSDTRVEAVLRLLHHFRTSAGETWMEAHAWSQYGPVEGALAVMGEHLLVLDRHGYPQRSDRRAIAFAAVPTPCRMRQVAALGGRHWLLLDMKGTVWCGGATGGLAPLAGAPAAVRSLAASTTHCLLLAAGGEVWSGAVPPAGTRPCTPGVHWSRRNTSPALGRRRSGGGLQRVGGLPPVRQVAAGVHVSFFLDVEGRVWSCGSDQDRQLLHAQAAGIAVLDPVPVPAPVDSPAVQLAAVAGNVATVHLDGTLCCGGRHRPQTDRLYVCLQHAAEVAVSESHTVVRMKDGSVYTGGVDPHDGKLCTRGWYASIILRLAPGLPVKRVAACTLGPGEAFTLLLRASGGAELWGGGFRRCSEVPVLPH